MIKFLHLVQSFNILSTCIFFGCRSILYDFNKADGPNYLFLLQPEQNEFEGEMKNYLLSCLANAKFFFFNFINA